MAGGGGGKLLAHVTQVRNRALKYLWIILERPKPTIASMTQIPADRTRLMVMVQDGVMPSELPMTDRANPVRVPQ